MPTRDRSDQLLEPLEALARCVGVLSMDRLLELTMGTMISLSGAQRGFLVIQEDDRLVFRLARNFTKGDIVSPTGEISYTIVRDVALSREVKISIDAQEDDRYSAAESVQGIGIRSVLACPLVSLQGNLLGVCYLDDLRGPGTFDEDDVRMLVVFSTQAATAIEAMQLSAELGQKEEQLAHMDDLRKDFIHAMSHELRTPLATVQTALDMMPHILEEDPRNRLVEEARQGLDRFAKVITRLLLFTSQEMEQAIHTEKPQVVSLRALIQEWFSAKQSIAQKKGLRLNNLVPKNIQCVASPIRLSHALGAIIDNAVRYTVQGSVSAEAGLVTPQSEPEVPAIVMTERRLVVLRVRDTGPGIPEDEVGQVFEKFFRGQRYKESGIPYGLGLGLATARREIEAMGGAILLQSQESQGTTVSIYLPVAPEEETT